MTAELSDALLQFLLRSMSALSHDPGIDHSFGCLIVVADEAQDFGIAVAFPHLTVREILRTLQTMRC